MTPRERAGRTLAFEQVDRPAADIGSSRVTGMSAWSMRALRRRLGLPEKTPRVFDLTQMNAEVDSDLLDALSCDFVMLPMQQLPLGLANAGEWKPFRFWDGQEMLVPAQFNPRVEADGRLLHGDGQLWQKPTRVMPQGCRYFEHVEYPDVSRIDFEIPHIPEDEWQLPELFASEYLRIEAENARRLFNETGRSVVSSGCLGLPVGYLMPIGWSIKMIEDPGHCRRHMMKSASTYAERVKQYLHAVGEYVDVIILSQTDFGSQNSELFNPALFEEFFVPAWRVVTDAVHDNSAAKVFIHSCGSVFRLIEHFISAGVDIYNPVQWCADGMNRERLAESFGGRIVFWGGGVHTQQTFPFGAPDAIRAETRESIEALGRKGGYVLNPGHNIQADVPPENVVAFYCP